MLIQKNTARTRGFTLTEAAIVLGIVGLILGAIWSAAGAVFRNQRVGQTTQQIIQIVQAIRSMNATSPTLDQAMDLPSLIAAGAFPKDMVASDNKTVTDLWGGQVDFVPNYSGAACGASGTLGNCFTLTWHNIPPDACVDLLSRNAGPGHDSGLFAASGKGTVVTNSDAGTVATVTTAANACNPGGGNSAPVDVTFTFMLKG